jgi:hypothetical protein
MGKDDTGLVASVGIDNLGANLFRILAIKIEAGYMNLLPAGNFAARATLPSMFGDNDVQPLTNTNIRQRLAFANDPTFSRPKLNDAKRASGWRK